MFLQEHATDLVRAAELVIAALRTGKKVLLFGNGGSAADAQHIAAEFVGRYLLDRPALPAIALTTDTSALTALSNDFGYDQVFARQVRALGQAGDVALAISTSGNSPSVLRAVDACRTIGISTIGLTGGTGGALRDQVDVVLCVSAFTESPHIQETHIAAAHALCLLVDRAFATPAS